MLTPTLALSPQPDPTPSSFTHDTSSAQHDDDHRSVRVLFDFAPTSPFELDVKGMITAV